jgi:chromosome segregation ATPase
VPAGFDILAPTPADRLPTVEVAAVAEYGPAPGFVGAIPYAIHAWTRRKELVAALADARRHRKAAEIGVEEALSALGRAVVEKADSLGGAVEALTEDLEGAQAAVGLVGAQQEASARVEVDTEERRRVSRRNLEALRREIDPVKDRETKLTTQLEVRQQDLARARAKLKRAEIEQRNTEHDPSRPPQSAALALADLERHQQEVAVADGAVRDLADQLAQIKRDLAERLGRAAQIEDDLRGLDREKEQTQRAALEIGGEAAQNARRALALLARRAIAANVAASADAELTGRVSRADEDLQRRRRRERIVFAAIDSYDKPTVYQGLGLIGGALLVVVVFVLFVLARAIS